VRHGVVVVLVTYNIYIIYIIIKSLSRFSCTQKLLKPFNKSKFYELICIINFKYTLFKGFTRGGALDALSHEAKFQQDAKI
jgi:hypothetical protein